MAMTDKQTLWVGRQNIEGSDDVFVHDPEMQDTSSDKIFLFSLTQNWMQQFQKDGLRKYFSKVTETELNKTATQQYLRWKEQHYDEFVKLHPITEEQKIQAIVEKHKKYLERIQKSYSGFKSFAGRKPRATHCFTCNKPLDNKIDIECNGCGWIICNRCGACGCGYDPNQYRRRKGFL